ncbi:MAG: Flp pilus assembly protein CpaB, partial [Acidimicrobiales bacterium]
LLAGFAIFVGGSGGAAYLGSRHSGPTSAGVTVPVLYATATVGAGTQGAAALSDGRIRSRSVAPATRPGGAVTDPSQLTGRVAVGAIAPGSFITTDMFAAPQTRIGSVVIPPGMRALTLELSPVPGVSGFVGAGDRIDVYGVANTDSAPPSVRLVLQGVQVLNVNGSGLPSAQGQPGGPNLVYLLAVTPAEAERLIYLNEYDKLYFDLVPTGEGAVTTPGATPTNAFSGV